MPGKVPQSEAERRDDRGCHSFRRREDPEKPEDEVEDAVEYAGSSRNIKIVFLYGLSGRNSAANIENFLRVMDSDSTLMIFPDRLTDSKVATVHLTFKFLIVFMSEWF